MSLPKMSITFTAGHPDRDGSRRCVGLVWTPRGGARRIISMRFAHAEEETRWSDPDDAPELTSDMRDTAGVFDGDRFLGR